MARRRGAAAQNGAPRGFPARAVGAVARRAPLVTESGDADHVESKDDEGERISTFRTTA